jgi:hypothetical protein
MEGDMVVRKYEGYSGRMICGTLLERWEGDMRDVIGEMGWGMRDVIGEMGWGICGTDHLPEIGPAGLPFLVPPPPPTKTGRQERQTINEPKKRMIIFDLTC